MEIDDTKAVDLLNNVRNESLNEKKKIIPVEQAQDVYKIFQNVKDLTDTVNLIKYLERILEEKYQLSLFGE